MQPILSQLAMYAFRGLSKVSLEYLAPVNLIVGDSNTGKTTVLEAAGLALRPTDVGQWLRTAGHRVQGGDLIDNLWSLFPDMALELPEGKHKQSCLCCLYSLIQDESRTIWLTAMVSQPPTESQEPTRDFTLSVHRLPTDVKPIPKNYAFSLEIGSRVGPGIHVSHRKSQRDPLPNVGLVTPSLHYTYPTMVALLSHAIDQGQRGLVLELLTMFDNNVLDIDITTSHAQPGIRIAHQTWGSASLSSFGESMRRCVALALSLAQAADGVLLIDDLETSLPSPFMTPVVASLIRAANSANVQILATTNSLDAVRSVIQGVTDHRDPSDLAGYWLNSVNNQVSVQRYDIEELQLWLLRDLDEL